jgi:hypothetical protein
MGERHRWAGGLIHSGRTVLARAQSAALSHFEPQAVSSWVNDAKHDGTLPSLAL